MHQGLGKYSREGTTIGPRTAIIRQTNIKAYVYGLRFSIQMERTSKLSFYLPLSFLTLWSSRSSPLAGGRVPPFHHRSRHPLLLAAILLAYYKDISTHPHQGLPTLPKERAYKRKSLVAS